jgi:hypothetical protein
METAPDRTERRASASAAADGIEEALKQTNRCTADTKSETLTHSEQRSAATAEVRHSRETARRRRATATPRPRRWRSLMVAVPLGLIARVAVVHLNKVFGRFEVVRRSGGSVVDGWPPGVLQRIALVIPLTIFVHHPTVIDQGRMLKTRKY